MMVFSFNFLYTEKHLQICNSMIHFVKSDYTNQVNVNESL